jgi:hypothetical protein
MSCYFKSFEEFFSHGDGRCGHVSLTFSWQSVQLGIVCMWGQNEVSLCIHVLGKSYF